MESRLRPPATERRPQQAVYWAALSIMAVAVSACGADQSFSNVEVKDSAGIRLVKYPGELRGTPMAAELLWEHGHGPGHYEFRYVSSGGLQPDGGAVVADFGNREVVAIGPDGSLGGVLAKTGPGPAEVMVPRAIVVSGRDTVWVEDAGNAKLMRFAGGVLAGTINLAELKGPAMMPLGSDGVGALLMGTSGFRRNFEPAWLDGHLARFDPATGVLDTVGSYPMVPRSPPSGRNPFSPHGVVTTAGGGFVHARTDRPELTWRNTKGETTQIARWQPTPRYPDSEMWKAFTASMRADLRRVNPGIDAGHLDALVEQQVASYSSDPAVPLPLFDAIRGNGDGAVWLAAFTPGNERPTRYLVVSGDGAGVGVVEFPRPLTVLDVRNDKVLGAYSDELDVQGVAVYRVRPGS